MFFVSKMRVAFLEEVMFELHFKDSFECRMELMKEDIPRAGHKDTMQCEKREVKSQDLSLVSVPRWLGQKWRGTWSK